MSDICIYFSIHLLSVNLSVSLFVHLFYCLSIICLSFVLLNVYLFFCLSTFNLICKLICLSIVLPNCLSMIVCVFVYVEICLKFLPANMSFNTFVCIFYCLPIDLSISWSYLMNLSKSWKPQCMGVIPHSNVVFYMEKHNALWFSSYPMFF